VVGVDECFDVRAAFFLMLIVQLEHLSCNVLPVILAVSNGFLELPNVVRGLPVLIGDLQ
jgi:hypothetical protein